MSEPIASNIPARRENWAHAVWHGGAKSVVTLKSGHVMVADEPPGFAGGAGGENVGPTPTGFLVAALASDVPSMLGRIARELAIELTGVEARVEIAWNPRGIAGEPGIAPIPFEARSEIRVRTSAAPALVERMKTEYEARCPLYNLMRKAGCRMLDQWVILPAQEQGGERNAQSA